MEAVKNLVGFVALLFKPQTIKRSLLVAFIFSALIPISFLATKLYQAAWDNAWR